MDRYLKNLLTNTYHYQGRKTYHRGNYRRIFMKKNNCFSVADTSSSPNRY